MTGCSTHLRSQTEMQLAPSGTCFLLCKDLQVSDDAGSLNVTGILPGTKYKTSCLDTWQSNSRCSIPRSLLRAWLGTLQGISGGNEERQTLDLGDPTPFLFCGFCLMINSQSEYSRRRGRLENTGGVDGRSWLVSWGRSSTEEGVGQWEGRGRGDHRVRKSKWGLVGGSGF